MRRDFVAILQGLPGFSAVVIGPYGGAFPSDQFSSSTVTITARR
jgi:hypothetical protein